MTRKTAHIDIRVEPEVIERIDAWRAKHRMPPSRSAAILYMIDQFLQGEPRPWAERLNAEADARRQFRACAPLHAGAQASDVTRD